MTIMSFIGASLKEIIRIVATVIFLFIALLALALLAPLLFTVGALTLALRFPESAPVWAIVYLILGPFACAIWMSVLSHLPTWVIDWKVRKAGGRIGFHYPRGTMKGTSFMFAGLFGSLLAEGVFTYAAHRMNVIPDHLVLFFSVAPFFVFAPCLLVVLMRSIRQSRLTIA